MRAKGSKPYFSTAIFEAIIRAAAPSFKPEALPAVTVPFSFLKEALSLAKPSSVVAGFTNSSLLNTEGSPFFCRISTPIISSANLPDACAAAAFSARLIQTADEMLRELINLGR